MRRCRGGTVRAGPPASISSRASPLGSFSCHRPRPFSTRWRRVTPLRASRWSLVSWYVETNTRDSSASPPRSGIANSLPGDSFTSRSSVSLRSDTAIDSHATARGRVTVR